MCSFCMSAAFNRCVVDRVIDIVIQCLWHDVAGSSNSVSSLKHQTCRGSALSADHLCSSGATASCFFLHFVVYT